MTLPLKCKHCDDLKEMLSYDEREAFKVRIVCHDKTANKYGITPMTKRIGQRDVLHRIDKMPIYQLRFAILMAFIVLLSVLLNSWFLGFVAISLYVMVGYMLFQLHFEDVNSMRLVDITFNNETRANLQNMGFNPNNNLHEAFPRPSFKQTYHQREHNLALRILKIVPLVRTIVTTIQLCCLLGGRYKIVREHLAVMSNNISFDDIQNQQLRELLAQTLGEIEGFSKNTNFQILGVLYFANQTKQAKQ